MEMNSYDLVVIGGGPGGYVAAAQAAKKGKKTALVEASDLGGTCLNRGCIPSKTLLRHAEVIEQIQKAKGWGIETGALSINFTQMMSRKDQVIAKLRNGIQKLLESGKVDVYNGMGKVLPNLRVIVTSKRETTELSAGKIIIATGSRPTIPPIHGVKDVPFHTTDTIFQLEEIPKSLIIIGGGVIGVEIASIFSGLGTQVTVVELSDCIIPTEDEEASKALYKSLKKKGIKMLTNAQVRKVSEHPTAKVVFVLNKKGQEEIFQADELLIATGRTPNVEAVEGLGLEMDGSFIKVNSYLETSQKGIFAIGDVIGNLQLAHVASKEGIKAVGNLDQHRSKMDYKVVPRCIYTSPQIASTGMTERELKQKNMPYRAHIFPMSNNGMAHAIDETDGFSKVLVDEKYGEILGVVMVGAHVTEIISQTSSYMYLEGTIDELSQMIQPHPSLSEVLMESANALVDQR